MTTHGKHQPRLRPLTLVLASCLLVRGSWVIGIEIRKCNDMSYCAKGTGLPCAEVVRRYQGRSRALLSLGSGGGRYMTLEMTDTTVVYASHELYRHLRIRSGDTSEGSVGPKSMTDPHWAPGACRCVIVFFSAVQRPSLAGLATLRPETRHRLDVSIVDLSGD